MTISSTTTITSEENTSNVQASREHLSLWDLPKSIWVGAGLFAVNVVVGIGMFITPNLQTDMFGGEVNVSSAGTTKPSPFTEVVDTKKRKVRVAAKLHPVTFVPAPDYSPVESYSAASLDMPRATVRPAQLDIPRATRAYQLDLPVRTEKAVYRTNQYGSLEMPRSSAVDRRFIAIN